MTSSQIRIGIVLLAAQVILLTFMFGFHLGMDERAAQDGVSAIIQEATR